MTPTNKLRWVTRLMQTYPPLPLMGGTYTGIITPNVTVQVSVLQQWWSGINNNGDAIGEWRDVPVEVE